MQPQGSSFQSHFSSSKRSTGLFFTPYILHSMTPRRAHFYCPLDNVRKNFLLMGSHFAFCLIPICFKLPSQSTIVFYDAKTRFIVTESAYWLCHEYLMTSWHSFNSSWRVPNATPQLKQSSFRVRMSGVPKLIPINTNVASSVKLIQISLCTKIHY